MEFCTGKNVSKFGAWLKSSHCRTLRFLTPYPLPCHVIVFERVLFEFLDGLVVWGDRGEGGSKDKIVNTPLIGAAYNIFRTKEYVLAAINSFFLAYVGLGSSLRRLAFLVHSTKVSLV